MNHQYLTNIILRGNVKKQVERNIVPRGQRVDLHQIKIENEQENFTVKRIHRTLCKDIVAARIAKKMSQKDVARQINIQHQVLNEIESGKAIYNQKTKEIVQKMQKLFGVKFPNK